MEPEKSNEIQEGARFGVEQQNHKEKGVLETPPSLTPSDLGAKRDGCGFGWRAVAADDPSIVDAAEDALKAVQQRSNSLIPYELHQIVEAKAEVGEEGGAKYEMLLKLKRGDKEEKMRVTVHKDHHGAVSTLHLH